MLKKFMDGLAFGAGFGGSVWALVREEDSGAFLERPESYFNTVRLGILMYGLYPTRFSSPSVPVKPIARLVTRILGLRELPAGSSISYGRTFHTERRTLVATLPIGFADGYPKALSNTGDVLVRGRRARVLGQVCMDATMVDVTLPGSLDNLWPVMGPVVDADFGPEIEAYLATRGPEAPKTVADLVAGAEAPAIADSPTPLNPARIQGFRDAIASGGYASEGRRKSIEELMPDVRNKLLALLEDGGLDGLVFPTMPCPASPRHDAEDARYACEIDDPYRPCYMASTSGFPEITVPAGFTAADEMPAGLSFLGRPFSETELVRMALDFEQAAGARQVPAHTPVLGP